jgi:hypothetical protein
MSMPDNCVKSQIQLVLQSMQEASEELSNLRSLLDLENQFLGKETQKRLKNLGNALGAEVWALRVQAADLPQREGKTEVNL